MDYNKVEAFFKNVLDNIIPEKREEFSIEINGFLKEFKENYVFDIKGLKELPPTQKMVIDENISENDLSEIEEESIKSKTDLKKNKRYENAVKIFKEMDENRIYGKI